MFQYKFVSISLVSLLGVACTDPNPKFGTVPAGDDSGDTGLEIPDNEGSGTELDPWVWDGVGVVSCADVFQAESGENFGSSTYYQGGTMPGNECACSFHVDSGGTLYAAHGLRVLSEVGSWTPKVVVVEDNTGWYYDEHLDGSAGDAGTETFYPYPLAPSVTDGSVWMATWIDRSAQSSSNSPGGTTYVISVDGEYRVYASRLGTDDSFHSCSTLDARVDLLYLGCEVPDGYTIGQRVNDGCGEAAGPPAPSVVGETDYACVNGASGTTTFRVGAWPSGYAQALWYQSGLKRYGKAWMSALSVTSWGDATFIEVGGQRLEKTTGSSMSFTSETTYIGGAHVVSDGSPSVQVNHTCTTTGWSAETKPKGFRVTFDEIFSAMVTPPDETEDAAEASDPGTSTPFVARLTPVHTWTSSGWEQQSLAVEISIEGMRNIAPPLYIPVTPATGGGFAFDYDNDRFHVEGSFSLGSSSATVTLTDGWINDLDENGDPIQLDLIDSGSITLTLDEAD